MYKFLFAFVMIACLWMPLGAHADSSATIPSGMTKDVTFAQVNSQPSQNAYSDHEDVIISDPLEIWNRIMFTFNDMFYHVLLKPISQVYAFLIPEPMRVAVNHFFHNLAMPKHFFAALLQGKVEAAGVELSRFAINTVLGGLGFFDVASTEFNLKSSDEDIGQTLGAYGVGEGFYIEWPLLGPANLRDTVGLVGDHFLNPLAYYPPNPWTRMGIYGTKVVNHTSLHIGEYEDLKNAAIDPYISLRDAYQQMRRDQVRR